MRINTNISAIVANGQLQNTEDKLSLSLERLSSGYKINHSKDDPVGLAISQKMRTQIRGLNQADNNAQDGVSVLQTAEGALTEIQSMITRMKELAVQAANDIYSNEERQSIQDEINSLTAEIDRIADETDFNTQSLLNGNLTRRTYSDVSGVKQMEVSDGFPAAIYGITVTQDARQAVITGTPITMTDTETIDESLVGTITLNGVNVNVEEGDTLNDIATKLSDAMSKVGGIIINTADTSITSGSSTETAGYRTTALATGTSFVMITDEYGRNEELKVECDNPDLAAKLGLPQEQVATGLDVQAEFTERDGKRVGFADSATMSTNGTTITVKDNNDKTFVMKVPGDVAGTTFDAYSNAVDQIPKSISQNVTDIGTMKVHVGANENQLISIDIPEVSSESLGLNMLNVYTHDNASKAISSVDDAVTKLSAIRSKIGAYQNRLDHTTSNLEISDENLTAALSRIIDVDMAEEMTEYTQQNILAQAGTSMLSQANERPETVLQLLQ